MTLLYNFGLTAGSLMAYFLESVLSPVDGHPCGPNPTHVKLPNVPNINVTLVSFIVNSTQSTLTTSLPSTLSTVRDNLTEFNR